MAKRVLIVEDHALVRAGMASLLRIVEPGAKIDGAGGYEEALTKLGAATFDVVFLDIDLRSAKTGLDLLAYIRAQDLPLKVIMLSGSDDHDTVMNCIAAGAAGYITKGASDETVFQRALATVMGGGVFLPESIVRGASAPLSWRSGVALGTAQPELSPRLREVLYYVCQGLPNKSIAQRMGIGEGTVRKTYVSELLRAFNVTRRTELIIEISRLGIRVPEPDQPPLAEGE
jgi:DNA-binding NarL/FixJ family response regulator